MKLREEKTMSNAIIIRKREEPASWTLIQTLAAEGKLGELLQVGDELKCQLKTGENVTFELADMRERPCFVLKDCVKDEKPMNKKLTNAGGWRDSFMREWLNGTIFHMMPDALQEIIVPRTIRQALDGAVVETEDKLWLPSFTEMFGKEGAEAWAPADTGDEQFQLYTSEKSRVKEQGEHGTWWYWLRSPHGSNSTSFCSVFSNGSAYYDSASASYGVAFGFCL